MSDFKLLSSDELVAMCKNFMAKKPAEPQAEPDPEHEGWRGELVLTPRMVADILAANNEV